MKKQVLITLILAVAMVFSACGGDDGIAFSGQVTTIAGSPFRRGPDDGPGVDARFWLPKSGVYVGGYLYVTDTENNLIRRVSVGDNVFVTTMGLVDNATGTPFQLGRPAGITSDGSALYVTEIDVPNVVRRISLADNSVTTIAATADQAHGLAIDNVWLYIADTEGNAIRKVSLSTGQEFTLALTDAGTGNPVLLSKPGAILLDGSTLYLSDTENHVVRKVSLADNTVTTLAGEVGVPGSADGVGTAARLFFPRGLALRGGELFVADEDNFTIRKISLAGGAVTTVAGKPRIFGNADGTPAEARFNYPQGIVWAGDVLIVIDSDNHMLRKIVLP